MMYRCVWNVGKQNSPRFDAAKRGVPSVVILFPEKNLIENEIKTKHHT